MKNTMQSNQTVKVHPQAIGFYVDATWSYAHQVLWNNFPFGKDEISLAKHYIREYYEGIAPELFAKEASLHFISYCARIRMAKRYVMQYAHRYIPHPCMWLNKRYSKGFAGTRAWYERAVQKAKRPQMKVYLPYMGRDNYNPFNLQFHYTA